jgi:TM2 domain-containing membrane protein YozV
MKNKKDLIETLKKEFLGQKVIVYPGPKQQFKIALTVILSLCFIFGIGMLSTRRLLTGHTIFAYNSTNWPGIVLLIIPLILGLYWLKKR